MNLIHFFTLGFFPEYIVMGIILGILIGIYTLFRVKYALNDSNLSKNKQIIISSIIAILSFLFCLNIWSMGAILIFYLFISSLIADLIRIIQKYLIKEKHLNFIPIIHKKGLLAIIIFTIIILGSVYGMNHIELTEYNLTTDKIDNKSYSILFISDVHYGTVQNTQLVKDSILKMNNLKPDIVLLGGDIVDERTTKDSMQEIFEELGKINSTYGTYYIFGNHDRQPYTSDYENGNRTFTDSDLNQSIEKNRIKILNDDKITINNDFVLVGRSDAEWEDSINRTDVNEILNESDLSKYIVVLDHQPVEYEENAQEGVDLQLSGHTHGGQVFPYGMIYDLSGRLNYGEYEIKDMKQIVSSGLTGWGWPMRNEAKCEYVLININ
ncbi:MULTISPECIES: metallophosphoesterase [unclassified Methanobrevibacter]|uniref:metallophosphoesterase n=1 Tax=unclassified Methanobrevibacter TaxID=2638681 RepID=UPI0025F525D8|nr:MULTISPECIES: metallophosphoesterase [unclassified Methanobrevibacter]MEE0941981.1 metallophosphoesterase [Methanobrevibacter sp.]